MSNSEAWIQTFSGGKFHILDPHVSEVHIEDIAHGLSMLCRWTGQCKKFYSIAEHAYFSSLVVKSKDPVVQMWSLNHDDSEAYISDLSRPLKHFTPAGPAYMEIEEKIMRVICAKFGLPEEQPEEVTEADTAMLYAERLQLMPLLDWDTVWGSEEPAPVRLKCWRPEVAKEMFLARFAQLKEKIKKEKEIWV